jgi:hypothetical protein
MNTSEWLLVLIALVGAVVNYLQQREQNQIFREQNQIFANPAGKTVPREKPRFIWLKRYWPTLVTLLLFVLIGYDIYDCHHSVEIPEWDEARAAPLVINYGGDPDGCFMTIDSKSLVAYARDYQLAIGCFFYGGTQDVLDAPNLQVSNLYDIKEGQILIRITYSQGYLLYRQTQHAGLGNIALLLIPKGIASDQFSTLRQARNLKVKIPAIQAGGSGTVINPQPTTTIPIEGAAPVPTYIPKRNDYVCPKGWTPAGGWGENGVPTDPYRGVTCKEK